MAQDHIEEVGIDGGGRLYVRPASSSFDCMYRAGMEVIWDPATRRLLCPMPREWTYLDWFKQILAAAAGEYHIALKVTGDTNWTNIPAVLRAEIEGLAAD